MTITYPDASAADIEDKRDVLYDLEEALEELDKARPAYEEAHEYYVGRVPERFVSTRIQQLLTGSRTDFRVNMAGRVVSAVLDRLEISTITAETEDEANETEETPEEPPEPPEPPVPGAPPEDNTTEGASGAGPSPATELLTEAIWEHNEMDLEAPEIHEQVVSLGDAYAFVWPSDDGDGVDVFYNSPLVMRILYDEECDRKKRLAVKRWEIKRRGGCHVRVNLYYEDKIYKFKSRKKNPGNKAADYEPFVDQFTDENGEMENPYDEIPVFHFRTSRPYGRPEHLQAYGPQDAITKLVTNQMSLSDFAAFPQRYALAEAGSTEGDDDIDWGDEDGLNTEDRNSQLISGPGRVWLLNNIKSMGQFNAADVDQLLKPLAFYIGCMAGVTGTPVSYFALGEAGQNTRASGESQRQDKDPLTKKIENRQRLLGSTWRDLLTFGLKILGTDAKVHVSWKALQTVSDKDGWIGVQEQQKAGVPVRQSLLETGYTADQCDEWGYTEDEPDGSSPSPTPFVPPVPPPIPGTPPTVPPVPGAPEPVPPTVPGTSPAVPPVPAA